MDTLIGWWPRLALPRVRSGLVVLERGWLDLAVDPRRYRLSTSPMLVRALGRVLPSPDLQLLLDAPSAEISRRKPELEVAEVDRQICTWRAFVERDPSRFAILDASRSPAEVFESALIHIDERLARRQVNLDRCALALRCLGGPTPQGRRYSLISFRGAPRWLVPAGFGARGPKELRLYRPAGTRHVVAAFGLEAVMRLTGGLPFPSLCADPDRGLAPRVAEKLGCSGVQLGAAVSNDRGRPGRALLSAWANGRLVSFAKVATKDGSRLGHERRVLEALSSANLRHFVVPRVLAFFEWEGCSVLLLEPVPATARTDRPTGAAEIAALAELGGLAAELAGVLGDSGGTHAVHGDFCPWNSSPIDESRLALWDWEETRLGLPLEDLFYWRTQRLVLFGHGTPAELVRGALMPDAEVSDLCRRLGVDAEIAPTALEASLEWSLALPCQAASDGRLQHRALALLREAM